MLIGSCCQIRSKTEPKLYSFGKQEAVKFPALATALGGIPFDLIQN